MAAARMPHRSSSARARVRDGVARSRAESSGVSMSSAMRGHRSENLRFEAVCARYREMRMKLLSPKRSGTAFAGERGARSIPCSSTRRRDGRSRLRHRARQGSRANGVEFDQRDVARHRQHAEAKRRKPVCRAAPPRCVLRTHRSMTRALQIARASAPAVRMPDRHDQNFGELGDRREARSTSSSIANAEFLPVREHVSAGARRCFALRGALERHDGAKFGVAALHRRPPQGDPQRQARRALTCRDPRAFASTYA